MKRNTEQEQPDELKIKLEEVIKKSNAQKKILKKILQELNRQNDKPAEKA